MKPWERVLTAASDLLLLLLAVYSLVYLTALSFFLEHSPLLAAGLLPLCLIFWIFFTVRRSRLWIAGLLAAALALLLPRLPLAPLAESVRASLHLITRSYARTYEWFPGALFGPEGGDCTWFLLALGGVLAIYFGWALIAMRRHPGWAVGASALLLAPIAAIQGYPNPVCLVGLVTFWAVLLLTGSIRGRRNGDAARLTLGALPVTAGLLVLGLAVIQPESYQPNEKLHALIDRIAAVWEAYAPAAPSDVSQDEPANQEKTSSGPVVRPEEDGTSTGPAVVVIPSPQPVYSSVYDPYSGVDAMDLTALGPLHQSSATVVQVYTDTSGILYLRSASMGDYTGESWEPIESYSGERSVSPLGYTAEACWDVGQVSTLILRSEDLDSTLPYLLTPYYTRSREVSSTGDVFQIWWENQREYVAYGGDLSALTLPEEFQAEEEAYRDHVHQVYTQLPDDTRSALLALAEEAGLEAGGANLVNRVADYVKHAAVYRTTVQAYPAGTDCAVYFLTEGKEGYCVHFATAAATLYRALGIPARLVTGYTVTAAAEEWTDVTGKQAHAWVELYQDGVGWYPVEVTGSVGPSGNEANPEGPDQPVETLPVGIAGQAQSSQSSASSAFWPVLLLAALAAGIVLRRNLILRRRERQWADENRNQAAVALWRYAQRLERQGGAVPNGVEALAQKACFSAHNISEEERSDCRAKVIRAAQQLRQALPRWKELWLRFGWCLW